ncbi:PH domain-containing protein [Natronosalvus vescus]|uniref:PH domain-containing protein n=1 Tax=Natronosalvus vescus TaxID=2953881 RepID=UPI002091884E|nr:PH domain-containing protein [Natronosalvus vescus]
MRRLHPASVAVRSLSRSLNLGFLFFVIGVFTSPSNDGMDLLVIGGFVLAGIAVGVLYEFAYYRRFEYALTDDTFDVVSGVVSRRDREVPLRRVQNVDVRQTALHRVLGIAAVHVETAGGSRTEVTLRYVDEAEARRLTRELRSGSGSSAEAPSVEDADEPDSEEHGDARGAAEREQELFAIERHELAILCLFTIDPGASLLGGIALSFASGFDPTTLVPVDILESDLPGTGLAAIGWALLLFLLAAWVLSALVTFTRYYGFRLTRVGDELHYERGLVQRYSGTIPLEKVQTITITQSVPFRWGGYASLGVETAGYGPEQSGSRGTESAIPLATYPRVVRLARSIEPFDQPDLERPPLRARERYAVRYIGVICLVLVVGYLLAAQTAVVRDWYAFAPLLVLVPLAAHLKWRNRGFQLGERYFVAQTGFWRRSTKIVPYYRVQSVLYSQTVFQRRRHLASVTADTASSATLLGRAATAYDVDATGALEMQRAIERNLNSQLQERTSRRTLGRWFDRNGDDGAENANRDDSSDFDSHTDATDTVTDFDDGSDPFR